MADAYICKEYAVEAEPSSGGSGFVGWYSIPGKDRQLARGEDRRAEVFDTEDEAIAAAAEDLCAALNGRIRLSWKYGYRRMTGGELAQALARLDLSPSRLAVLYGTTQRRVLDWIDGAQDIPHPLRVLVAVMEALPDGLDAIQAETNAAVYDKREAASPVAGERRPA